MSLAARRGARHHRRADDDRVVPVGVPETPQLGGAVQVTHLAHHDPARDAPHPRRRCALARRAQRGRGPQQPIGHFDYHSNSPYTAEPLGPCAISIPRGDARRVPSRRLAFLKKIVVFGTRVLSVTHPDIYETSRSPTILFFGQERPSLSSATGIRNGPRGLKWH